MLMVLGEALGNAPRHCLVESFQKGKLQDRKVYSQLGEDGILEAIHGCLGRLHNGYYVEFGVQSGVECSTRLLREQRGWSGLLMDGGFENSAINLKREMIFSHNIVELFQKHNVPMVFDHLTVDIDLNTFHVAQAILSAGYRPKTLIIEMNRNFHPLDQSYTTINLPNSMWLNYDMAQGGDYGDCYFGASSRAVSRMAEHFGYLPVAFDEQAVNLFFVHSSEVGGIHPMRSEGVAQEGGEMDRHFNLEAAYNAMRLASPTCDQDSCLRPGIHMACFNHVWLKVGPKVNFSSPDWVDDLEPVVLTHSSTAGTKYRVFREEVAIVPRNKAISRGGAP